MASIYHLLYEQAMASGLSPDTPVLLTVQWRVGLDIFDDSYQPPQEHLVTVADLQNKFVSPDSGVREMVVFNTDILNIRPEPNTTKPRSGYLTRGEKIRVKPIPGNSAWMELLQPQTGYVSAAFLKML